MDNTSNPLPIHPEPLPVIPNYISLYLKARKDLIGFWDEESYERDLFGHRFLNRSMFVANSPATVEHVFIKKHSTYERKSPFMRKALEPLLGDGLFVSDGATWKKHRGLQAPAFNTRFLANFAEVMISSAVERSDYWEENCIDRETPILTEMASMTAEILSRCLFGNDLGRKNAEKIVAGFHEYQACIEQFDVTSFFGLPDWLPRLPQRRRVYRMAKKIHVIVDAIIDEHMRTKPSSKTLLSMLLDAYNPDSDDSLTREQIRNEVVVLLMAGHETTANSLAWTWYLLAHKPEVAVKLHEELDRVLDNRIPTYDDMSSLVYTRAVFEEALRLYPPVPVLSRQSCKDDKIGRRKIPSGSIMMVVPWLLHRHRKYWYKPNEFIPERFLPDWPHKHEKYAYIPFSAGPRFCLGAAFGLTEAVLCLAILARKFVPELVPGKKVEYECRLTLRPKHKLPMIIRKR